MRLNLGIRRRLAPLVDYDRRQMELLHGLLLTLPGSPVLYYGDEIGMGDNIYQGDRNGVRTPMHWTSDRNAGFSRADPSPACAALKGHYRKEPARPRRGGCHPRPLRRPFPHPAPPRPPIRFRDVRTGSHTTDLSRDPRPAQSSPRRR
jgi:Alpha amylase, catalytic domain